MQCHKAAVGLFCRAASCSGKCVFAKHEASAQWCWVTADLNEQQNYIGVHAVSQGCCQLVSQSSTVQWKVHFAKHKASVHWFWVSADLDEQPIFIGLYAVSQGCCQPICRAALCNGKCILPSTRLRCMSCVSLHT